jgi:hypothetical protein
MKINGLWKSERLSISVTNVPKTAKTESILVNMEKSSLFV